MAQESPALAHADLISRTASTWMEDVFAQAPPQIAALAMSTQLRAAGVPREALELLIGVWSTARQGLTAGAALPGDRARVLDRATAVQTHGLPVLRDWSSRLRARTRVAEDVDRVIELMSLALASWSNRQESI